LGVDEFGVGRLQRLVAAAQGVVFAVRDRRRRVAIAQVVLGDFGAEAFVFGASFGEGEFFVRGHGTKCNSERPARKDVNGAAVSRPPNVVQCPAGPSAVWRPPLP